MRADASCATSTGRPPTRVSSSPVTPAADMPRVALRAGARLVIVNQGQTPLDRAAHLRFEEKIGEVLPPAVAKLGEIMYNRG